MSETTIRVPASVAGDPSDVATALEVASALWEKGSREDAIRWIKRAVEAATEAGQDERADMLAASLAELERASDGPIVEAAPEPAEAEEVEEEAPPAPKAPPAHAATASRPPVPPPTPRPPTDPPPLPASASRAPAPPAKPAERPQAAPSLSPRPTSQPAPGAATSRGRVTAPPHTAAVAQRPAPVRLPTGQRIRVSVKTSVRDPGLLVVRPLAEGRRPPAGAREGFLVLEEEEAVETHSHANGSAPS